MTARLALEAGVCGDVSGTGRSLQHIVVLVLVTHGDSAGSLSPGLCRPEEFQFQSTD